MTQSVYFYTSIYRPDFLYKINVNQDFNEKLSHIDEKIEMPPLIDIDSSQVVEFVTELETFMTEFFLTNICIIHLVSILIHKKFIFS